MNGFTTWGLSAGLNDLGYQLAVKAIFRLIATIFVFTLLAYCVAGPVVAVLTAIGLTAFVVSQLANRFTGR